MKRLVSALSAAALLLLLCPCVMAAEPVSAPDPVTETLPDESDLAGYEDYLAAHEKAALPETAVEALPASATDTVDGVMCADLRQSGGAVTYRLAVPQSGFYRLKIGYYIDAGYTRPIKIALSVDGALPFRTADELTLPKIYANETDTFKTDRAGNQLCPSQVVKSGWTETRLSGGEFTGTGCFFYLEQGERTVTVEVRDGAVALGTLTAENPAEPQAYAAPAGVGGTDTVRLQGETSARRSDAMLYPTYDRSDALTEPSDAAALMLNTVGGSSTWSSNHQWIEWDFTVNQTGLYKISLRLRQNEAIGTNVCRRFYIDGETPYAELMAYPIAYKTSWQAITLSANGEEMLFYLEAGAHTLRIEAVPGEAEKTVAVLERELARLNRLYRDIVMITGSSPDPSRDYYLDEQMPDLISTMALVSKNLRDEYDRAAAISNSLGSRMSFMRTFAAQLDDFCASVEELPERLSYFKTNISSLSSLMITMKSLPLEIDFAEVRPPESAAPRAKAGFFETLTYEFRRFIVSFINDYDAIGNYDEEQYIEVWTTFGRDQTQLIRNIIDNHFTEESGISVKLCLVPGSNVVAPIMAGKAPDVLIGADRTLPINLAARGQMTDLSGFDGFDEVVSRFSKEAMVPYRYDGGTYALPETQEFNMLFVRTDTFELLGLPVPETWDDVRKSASVILQNNLEYGLPNGIQASITSGMSGGLPTILPALLLQNGMTWYQNDSSTKTVFSTREGSLVFKEFTEFYTKYAGSVYYDAVNRFRTGEMPLLIAPFSTYNALYIQAPEIRGLWEMYPIPGTATAEGINIAEEDSGVCTVMLCRDDKCEQAWEFMKWWSGADVQSEYALRLESLLGPAARYATANLEAFATLPWSVTEQQRLGAQRESIRGIPANVASYIISRNIANAFLEVVSDGKFPMETITNYAITMDNELERKYQQIKR